MLVEAKVTQIEENFENKIRENMEKELKHQFGKEINENTRNGSKRESSRKNTVKH